MRFCIRAFSEAVRCLGSASNYGTQFSTVFRDGFPGVCHVSESWEIGKYLFTLYDHKIGRFLVWDRVLICRLIIIESVMIGHKLCSLIDYLKKELSNLYGEVQLQSERDGR